MIKKALLIVCAIVLSGYVTASAQSYLQLQLGPYISAKAGVNTGSIVKGRNTGMTFNVPPDFGVTFNQPFNKKKSSLAIMFDIGYNTTSIFDKHADSLDWTPPDSEIITTSVHYLNISPCLHIKGFVVGLNLGFALSADSASKGGIVKGDYKNTDKFSSLLEIRIGGMIPLMEDETGVLNMNITAAYALSGLYVNDESDYNPKQASLSLGFSYLFNVSDR
ncbi:MAG: hypothetical protein HYZ54_07940 [Ignavibacteriae bacterium]|nr:hypothetical protein [Ignavibacteriota bacterium]